MTENDKDHYFDWAATSPADSDIVEKALQRSLESWGNPSSIHKVGTEAREAFESARNRCAKVLNVPGNTLYFTSGGTESDHIPLLSMLNRPEKGTILVSSIEHAALREQAEAMKHCGWNVKTIPCTQNGFITPEAVLSCLTSDTVIVCVMAVNNETGAIQDIAGIAAALDTACKGRRRPHFHTDCVQAAGKIPLTLFRGIDSAAFSAHKLCGPRGTGLLYLSRSVQPFLRGGGQEKSIRSGTENLFGAEAFADCLGRYYIGYKNNDAVDRYENQKVLTAEFIKNISSLPGCSLIPHIRSAETEENRFSPWIVQAGFSHIPGQVMVRALSAKGFYISTGSACSAKKQNRPILEAMRIPPEERETAVRFSFGPHTTEKAMKELFQAVKDICAAFNR